MVLFKIPDYIKISLEHEPRAKIMWSQFVLKFRIIWYGKKWRAWKARVKASRGTK